MMRFVKTLFVLLLAMAGQKVCAQKQAAIDSMLKILVQQKEDTNKVKLLNELSDAFTNVKPDEGIKYGQQGLALAAKLGWKQGEAILNNTIGSNHKSMSDFTKALECYHHALKIYEKIEDKKGVAIATGNIGIVYQNQGDYQQALEYYLKDLAIDEETNDKNRIAAVTSNIGVVYKFQSDYARALEYFFKSLKINEETGNKRGIAGNNGNIGTIYESQQEHTKALTYFYRAYNMYDTMGDKNGLAGCTVNIGIVYKSDSNYPKALEYFSKALKLFEETGNKMGVAFVTKSLGEVYNRQKNYIMAIFEGQKALKIAQEIGNKHNEASGLSNIGISYLSLITDTTAGRNKVINSGELPVGEYIPDGSIPEGNAARLGKAIEYLEKGLAVSKAINEPDIMQDCYANLSTAYKLNGDYKKALEYADISRAIKDSIFSTESKVKITNLETQRLKDLKDKQIQIDKLEIEKKRNERVFYIAGICLLLVVVGLTARSNSMQKRLNKTITKLVSEQEQTIQQRTAELAESNKKLIHANKKLVELIQYNAHNLREPLTRISGAMIIQEYITSEEFYKDVWPQMQKAVTDLDNSIKEVISIADETVDLYG